MSSINVELNTFDLFERKPSNGDAGRLSRYCDSDYWMDNRGIVVQFTVREEIFTFSEAPRPTSETTRPSAWVERPRLTTPSRDTNKQWVEFYLHSTISLSGTILYFRHLPYYNTTLYTQRGGEGETTPLIPNTNDTLQPRNRDTLTCIFVLTFFILSQQLET